MSDQLAVSATFSVLMMAVWVLFGAEADRVPLGAPTESGFASTFPNEISAPSLKALAAPLRLGR